MTDMISEFFAIFIFHPFSDSLLPYTCREANPFFNSIDFLIIVTYAQYKIQIHHYDHTHLRYDGQFIPEIM